MTTINVIKKENLLDPNVFEVVKTDQSIGEWIVDNYYGTTTPYSVYEGLPSGETCITDNVELLCSGYGDYTVLETPGEPTTIAISIAIGSIVISAYLIDQLESPKIPDNVIRPDQSPNNSLSNRTNSARPLQRVPDIKGTVTSIPDVLYTYSRYIQNVKNEFGYYCVGRKKVLCDQIRDGQTPLELSTTSSIQIYYPGNGPNDLAPDVQYGEYFEDLVIAPYKSSQVKGQDLLPPGSSGLEPFYATLVNPDPYEKQLIFSSAGLTFLGLNKLEPTYTIDWLSTDYVQGRVVEVSGTADWLIKVGQPGYPGYGSVPFPPTQFTLAADPVNGLNNFYTLQFTTAMTNPNATLYEDYFIMKADSSPLSYIKTLTGIPVPEWVYMNKTVFDRGFINILGRNGIYTDSGGATLETLTVDLDVEVQEIDEFDNDVGASVVYPVSISNNNYNAVGTTVDFTFAAPTRFKVKTTRTTTKFANTDQNSDSLVLEDLYGIVELTDWVAGDITTIQTRTVPGSSRISIDSNRELNLRARETVDKYLGGGIFQSDLTPGDYLTVNASAVQSYISDFIDPKFGNRPLTEVDADGLLALDQEITTYFSNALNNQFNFTVDSAKMTMQEYTLLLFNAINSVAYRDGSIVKAYFEKPKEFPSMLFTHRSKIPGSESYNRNMNLNQLNDGIEFIWVNPTLNTAESIFIPEDRSAVNPKKLEYAGYRNEYQSLVRAWREYNKLLYDKIGLNFTSTGDGIYVKPGDVISVVKGSRVYTFDGEILAVSLSGYTLTLSQDVVFESGLDHFIILKDDNGNTETITVTAGSEANKVVLATLPSFTIRTSGTDYQRRTEFSFGSEDTNNRQLFISTGIDVTDKNQIGLTCYNYTDKYYTMDLELYGDAFSDGFSDGFA